MSGYIVTDENFDSSPAVSIVASNNKLLQLMNNRGNTSLMPMQSSNSVVPVVRLKTISQVPELEESVKGQLSEQSAGSERNSEIAVEYFA